MALHGVADLGEPSVDSLGVEEAAADRDELGHRARDGREVPARQGREDGRAALQALDLGLHRRDQRLELLVVHLHAPELAESAEAVAEALERPGRAAMQRDAHLVDASLDERHSVPRLAREPLRFGGDPRSTGERHRERADLAEAARAQGRPRVGEAPVQVRQGLVQLLDLAPRVRVQRIFREHRHEALARLLQLAALQQRARRCQLLLQPGRRRRCGSRRLREPREAGRRSELRERRRRRRAAGCAALRRDQLGYGAVFGLAQRHPGVLQGEAEARPLGQLLDLAEPLPRGLDERLDELAERCLLAERREPAGRVGVRRQRRRQRGRAPAT